MPSTRYTLRLPPALDAAVQAHISTTGIPFATLMRDSLTAYLADTSRQPPTSTAPTAADTGADMLRELQIQVSTLATRMEIVEQRLQALTPADSQSAGADREQTRADTIADTKPTSADMRADTERTGADTPPARGRRPGPLRQQILDLLQAHPEGLSAIEIKVYLHLDRNIGDVLQNMVRRGLVRRQGDRKGGRYIGTKAAVRQGQAR